MLKRIVVALIALPLFFLVVYFSPDWVLPVVLGLVSGLADYEMLHNTGLVKDPLLLSAAILLGAAAVPLTCFLQLPLTAILVPPAVVFFGIVIFSGKKTGASSIFAAYFAVVFISLALGSIARIRSMEHGISLVLLPFIAAWITDTFAYFTGCAMGRHKLAPDISPKKTVEGSIGGIVGCILIMLAYHFVAGAIWQVQFRLPLLLVTAAVGSIVSQIGDLALSYIKRDCGIKDYGTIMPGHGGILDRFDSVLFAAPLFELLLTYFSVIL